MERWSLPRHPRRPRLHQRAMLLRPVTRSNGVQLRPIFVQHLARPMASTSAAARRRQPATPEALDSLTSNGWTLASSTAEAQEGQRLSRDFRFKDFGEAWGFMSRVALAAEKLNVRRPALALPSPPHGICKRLADPFKPTNSITQNGRTCTTASRSPSRRTTRATRSPLSTSSSPSASTRSWASRVSERGPLPVASVRCCTYEYEVRALSPLNPLPLSSSEADLPFLFGNSSVRSSQST